jgi:apolipoprotein N-acyltransferase
VLLFGTVRLYWPAPAAQTVAAASFTPDPVLAQTYYQGLDLGTFPQWTDAQRAAARAQIEMPLNQMLARSETALRGGAQIVSWSEGAAAVLEEDKPAALARAAALARQYHAYLQMGLGVFTHAKALPFLLNQSILIDPAGIVRWTYDKTYPTFPTEAFITPYGPGDLPILDTPYGRLSTVICNDQHFPALLRQAGQNGVDLLLAPSHAVIPFGAMDVTLGTFRAIENGYTLVRPDGNGVSVMADPEGRVLGSQEIGSGNNGVLYINLPVRRVWTLYSQIGDVFAYGCVAGLILLTGWALVHREHPAAMRPQPA